MAAPSAVVSVTIGRSTGTAATSEMNWHSQSFTTMPPSTRRRVTVAPSRANAVRRSAV
jgi:hypothetical protein